jgi:AcrR family transcriptional regulator
MAVRRRYHHGDLRQALIDSALALIAKDSVEGLSLREVARNAGVTYAAPYHHFKDRAALLAVLAEEGFHALDAQLTQACEKAGTSLPARTRAMAVAYVRFAVRHRAHFRVMFGPELAKEPEPPSLRAAAEQAFGRVAELIAQALPAAAEAEQQALSLTVWGTVHGLASLWNDGALRHKEGLQIEPLAAQAAGYVSKLLHSLGTPAKQRRHRAR